MNREAGNAHACASCRHQRKRCDETCELAPYFPPNRYREFRNAHRHFGVNNILKIINSVEPHQRQDAAESILIESNARRNDKVHGCLGIVRNLQAEIEHYEKQLDFVNQQMAECREREKLVLQKQRLENFLSSDQFDHVLPDLSIVGDKESSDHGFNYESTMEEGVDVKPFDIQAIDDQMTESYNQNDHFSC